MQPNGVMLLLFPTTLATGLSTATAVGVGSAVVGSVVGEAVVGVTVGSGEGLEVG